MNERIANDNLFKAKAVGATQVGRRVTKLKPGRNRRLQVRAVSAEEMHILPDANEERGRANDGEPAP